MYTHRFLTGIKWINYILTFYLETTFNAQEFRNAKPLQGRDISLKIISSLHAFSYK